MKTSTFREQQTVTIHSPRAQVWEYAMDRAKIAEYNPRVARVELGSGTVMPGSTSAASTSFANGSPRCSLELGKTRRSSHARSPSAVPDASTVRTTQSKEA